VDKLKGYRQIIKRILSDYVALDHKQPDPNVESFLIVDDDQGHYLWMNLGWEDGKRTSGSTVYVRLRHGKFWIEEDWTEEGIATDLLAAGVPREDIVLAFQPPEMRKYTEFAAA
jgi:hypothetical protein